jgi:hypothetical protein
MVQTLYRPARDDQLKTTLATRSENCGPCATRVALRRASLGLLNPTIEAIRRAAGNTASQFTIYDVREALNAFGIPVAGTYGRSDNFEIPALRAWLAAGNYAAALGDYDEVPDRLSGDPRFDQNHLTFFNESSPVIAGVQYDGVLVYDSLDDGRRTSIPKGPIVWPWAVVERYLHGLSDRFDEDVTVCLVKRRLLGRKFDGVPVRPTPDDTGAPIGLWVRGPVEYGALVRGGTLDDPPDPNWYRIWWPPKGVVAFVSAAHARIV